MGAITPVMSVLPILSSAAGMINKNLDMFSVLSGNSQRKIDRADAQRNQIEMQNSLALQRIQSEQNLQAESARKDALRRAVARQRASFSAQGTGSAGGSADAVLLGLFTESEEDRVKRERLDSLRDQAQKIQRNGALYTNLLSATEDSERKKIERFYRY